MGNWAEVDVVEPELRRRLEGSLSHLGLGGGAAAQGAPFAVLRDRIAGDQQARAPVVRVCQGRLPRAWPGGENPFGNRAVRNYIGTQPELDLQVLSTTLTSLAHGTLLKLRELISPGAEVLATLEHSSARRAYHLGHLQRFLNRPQVPRYVRDHAQQALDELFTNAIYNAPVDAMGMRPFGDKPRTEVVVSPRPVSVRFGLDHNYAAVAVRDFYGSLDADRVLQRLQVCFQPTGAPVEETGGGAGLGFFLILQASSRLVINIHQGHFTEVISLHRLLPRRRDFLQTSISLNVCVRPGAQPTPPVLG